MPVAAHRLATCMCSSVSHRRPLQCTPALGGLRPIVWRHAATFVRLVHTIQPKSQPPNPRRTIPVTAASSGDLTVTANCGII